MVSRVLQTLRKQVDLIQRTYINFTYDPSGSYSRTSLMNAGAYILFVHAELETYLEERVFDVVQRAGQGWRKNRKTCRSLLALCTYLIEEPKLPQTHSTKDIFGDAVTKALLTAENRVRANHGIRQHNVVRLLHMIGFEEHLLDPILIAELDVFGTIRGEHAHQSPRQNQSVKFDPFDTVTRISNLLTLLEKFDSDFDTFRKAQFGR